MRSSNGSLRVQRGLVVMAIIGSAGMVVAFAPGEPHQQAQEFDREQVLRGRQMVIEHGCGGCHGGPLLTDMQRHVVGTGRGAEKETPYDTPTLVEIWRTAPYLHDGRARTLKDIFDSTGNGWSHSLSKRLNESEIDDLAAYVLTL